MKLGIMQPYFFPYIGYWQLINAVDQYVIYDDVNFIKGGWVNRNKILIKDEGRYFNLLLHKASPNKLIKEIEILDDKTARRKLLDTLKLNYSKAPYFNDAYPIIKKILDYEATNLAQFLINQIHILSKYLYIETEILISSQIPKDNKLKNEKKVLSICRILGADVYLNAIGGKELYVKEHFRSYGVELQFLKSKKIIYNQFGPDFIENLSIIDVIMFNSAEKVRDMLEDYVLI